MVKRAEDVATLRALIFNDLNLLFGVFGFALGNHVLTAVRLAAQYAGVLLLVWCGYYHSFGTYPELEIVAAGLLASAAIMMLWAVRKFEREIRRLELDLRTKAFAKWEVVYFVLHLMPIAAFLNLGVALTLRSSGPATMRRTIVWSLQLTIKTSLLLAVLAWYEYYEVYAKAWHCYTHEARLAHYTGGFCPAYTKDGSWLDPANTVCRTDSLRCYGSDRTYDQVPRSWRLAPIWVHHCIMIIIQVTLGQAAAGLYNMIYFVPV